MPAGGQHRRCQQPPPDPGTQTRQVRAYRGAGGPWPGPGGSPLLSLMSTAACASSSSEMSSVLPLSAAWCRAENLGTGRGVRGPTAPAPPWPLPGSVASSLHPPQHPRAPALPPAARHVHVSPSSPGYPLSTSPHGHPEKAATRTSRGQATSRPHRSERQRATGWDVPEVALLPSPSLHSASPGGLQPDPPACVGGHRAGDAAELGAGAGGADAGDAGVRGMQMKCSLGMLRPL